MRYHFRTGVDHQLKRKIITGAILAVTSIGLLGISANMLLNLRASRVDGDTTLSRAQSIDVSPTSGSTTESGSNPTSDTEGNTTDQTQVVTPSTRHAAPASNSPQIADTATGSSQPAAPIAVVPLPDNSLGAGELQCDCGDVPTHSTPVLHSALNTVDTTLDSIGGILDQ